MIDRDESITAAFREWVELQDGNGSHLRYTTGTVAAAMVDGGTASVAASNGKIRAIKLLPTGALIRIGEPSPPSLGGVRFTRWSRLEKSGTRVIEFHPRSTYE